MNERKLLVDTDTRGTMSSGLQHSESFTSLTPFVGKIKIKRFSFLRRLVNFDSHCMSTILQKDSFYIILFDMKPELSKKDHNL